jgi:hypothetical protein
MRRPVKTQRSDRDDRLSEHATGEVDDYSRAIADRLGLNRELSP